MNLAFNFMIFIKHRIRIKYILIILTVFFPRVINGQEKPGKRENAKHIIHDAPRNLKVGEQVPDIYISKIINNTKKSALISDFKGSLLILDFWTTGCSSCIAAFPKMDSLQKVFQNKLKILGVTYEPESRVNIFFKTNKYGKATHLPSVVEDKILDKWFKHWAIPHEVWIYKGKVIALTSGEYVTARNIQYVLDGKKVNWPIKNDFKEIDYSKPFANNVQMNKALSYITLTPFKEGVHNKKISSSLDSITKTRRNYFLNFSILNAYKTLWSHLMDIKPLSSTANRIILNVKDKSKYIYEPSYGPKEEWERKNQICYESITPDTGGDLQDQYRLMISDLNRLLGTEAHWEKRKIKCLVLLKIAKEDRIKSKGGESDLSFDKPIKSFRNTSLDNLVYTLNNYEGNPPTFNGTGYKDNIDMDLKINSWTDIQKIKEELQQYGLDLREEERELDMFVLTEK